MDLINNDLWTVLGAVGTFLGGVAAILTVLARHGWLRWVSAILAGIVAFGATVVVGMVSVFTFGLALLKLAKDLFNVEGTGTWAMISGAAFTALLVLTITYGSLSVAKEPNRNIIGWSIVLLMVYYIVGLWTFSWSVGDLSAAWIALLLAPPLSVGGIVVAGIAVVGARSQQVAKE